MSFTRCCCSVWLFFSYVEQSCLSFHCLEVAMAGLNLDWTSSLLLTYYFGLVRGVKAFDVLDGLFPWKYFWEWSFCVVLLSTLHVF